MQSLRHPSHLLPATSVGPSLVRQALVSEVRLHSVNRMPRCSIGRCSLLAVHLLLLLYPSYIIATTTCPSPPSIAANYLQAIKATQTNVFYPSAYFYGSAVKLVSAAGLTSITNNFLCVDGKTSPGRIDLYDDGTHGDDVAGDGLYSRACVHFCQSRINYADIWNFAYHQTFNSADLIVVKPEFKNQIPYHVIQSPKYPKAKIYATSHAVFFVDDQRHYWPTWPIDFVSLNTVQKALYVHLLTSC